MLCFAKEGVIINALAPHGDRARVGAAVSLKTRSARRMHISIHGSSTSPQDTLRRCMKKLIEYRILNTTYLEDTATLRADGTFKSFAKLLTRRSAFGSEACMVEVARRVSASPFSDSDPFVTRKSTSSSTSFLL